MNRIGSILIVLLVSLTLIMFGCSEHRTSPSEIVNTSASLPTGLPFNPFDWKIVTSSIDGKSSSMSTLYGNDAAVQCARTQPSCAYEAGSALIFVTWAQQEDDHWFGAKIPGQVKSVEYVTAAAVSDGNPSYSYELYAGNPLQKAPTPSDANVKERVNYVLHQRASIMP